MLAPSFPGGGEALNPHSTDKGTEQGAGSNGKVEVNASCCTRPSENRAAPRGRAGREQSPHKLCLTLPPSSAWALPADCRAQRGSLQPLAKGWNKNGAAWKRSEACLGWWDGQAPFTHAQQRRRSRRRWRWRGTSYNVKPARAWRDVDGVEDRHSSPCSFLIYT